MRGAALPPKCFYVDRYAHIRFIELELPKHKAKMRF